MRPIIQKEAIPMNEKNKIRQRCDIPEADKERVTAAMKALGEI